MKTRAERQIARGGVGESTVDGPPSESLSEQYSLAKILGIWAAAALPMGALAWVVAPCVAGWLSGPVPLSRALLASLTVGVIWQFVLVMVMVYRQRGSLRWPVLKDALWLRAPRSPRIGRVGGWLWLVLPAARSQPHLRSLRLVRRGSGVHVWKLGLVRCHHRPELV